MHDAQLVHVVHGPGDRGDDRGGADRLQLIDFGLAKVRDSRLTGEGATLGTPIAPSMISAAHVVRLRAPVMGRPTRSPAP